MSKELVRREMCEVGPFVWKGKLCLMECVRPAEGGDLKDFYVRFIDVATGKELGRCAEGYSLGSILVDGDTAHVYVSRWEGGTWQDVPEFRSRDLR